MKSTQQLIAQNDAALTDKHFDITFTWSSAWDLTTLD